MNFTNAGKNLLLDAVSGVTASLHTGNPGTNGAQNEVTGGAYARKPIGFATAVNGNRNASSLPTFDVPAGTTISHAALWSDGTCIATGPLSASESYTNAGTYTLTDADLTLLDS